MTDRLLIIMDACSYLVLRRTFHAVELDDVQLGILFTSEADANSWSSSVNSLRPKQSQFEDAIAPGGTAQLMHVKTGSTRALPVMQPAAEVCCTFCTTYDTHNN
jgi:hypothetical protein